MSELTVIAEKREQSIETVPVAITAFGAEQRKLMGIAIIQDLADFSPSLNWTDIDDRVYIRGIGRNSDNLNNTSGVAIYYNGIYYGANAAIEQQKSDLFIGNIEVDNGPQNTLHGSNADGGVVEFTSKRPTDTMYGEARVGVANYNTEFAESVVSGPLNDHLKFRLGANYTDQRGGFFNNLDGSPQGGNLVLGGSGQTQYFEGQLQGHWDHLDAWVMASSGNFNANTHGAAGLGYFPDSEFNSANTLTPSGFYGLCGLAGVAASRDGAACAGGHPIVPGSVQTKPITANLFTGNQPGNTNIRDFINEDNGQNKMQADVQISSHVTYHLPTSTSTTSAATRTSTMCYTFQPSTWLSSDSGVTQWQEVGAASAAAAGLCTLNGNTLAACQAPLTVNPTPNFLTFNEFDQAFSHELNFTSTTEFTATVYRRRLLVSGALEPAGRSVQHDAPATDGRADVLERLRRQLCGRGPRFARRLPTPPSPARRRIRPSPTTASPIYGQASYKFNDQFKFSGAMRYTNDHKQGWQTWRVIDFEFDPYRFRVRFRDTGIGSHRPRGLQRSLTLPSGLPRRWHHDDQSRDRQRPTHARGDLERADRRGQPRLDARSHHAGVFQV